MKTNIRIILLEDQIADAELVKYTLRDCGLTFTLARVDTREDFVQQLEQEEPDLILSDYGLPSFDGLSALKIAQDLRPDAPFIFVTGTLGEERAIETLKRGATDYVLKTRLSRLVPAVHRALRESGERVERKRAEERLRESHEQLRALSVYLQHVREEERTRIAREIHDELGQALTGLKFEISALGAGKSQPPRTVPEVVKTAASRIDAIIQSVRRISTELRPGILDDLGLVAAIEWQAVDFQTRTGIRCDVTASVNEATLSEEAKTALFRIFQETITNILRHAGANHVVARLYESPGRVRLEVKDDGRGITVDESNSSRSLGLLGMRERTVLLGGVFRIQGAPGQGTTVSVEIPGATPAPNRGAAANENPHRGRSRRGAPRLEANTRL